MDTIQTLQQYIDQSSRIVFFGGAGVSTESGIKDFRGVDGLYHLKYKYNPETILSHSFFLSRPDEFYEFYQDKIVQPTLAAAPNTAHRVLAQLEQAGKLTAVVTQNIDGFTRWPAARMCWNCTAASTATTACNAVRNMVWMPSATLTVCPAATAAA